MKLSNTTYSLAAAAILAATQGAFASTVPLGTLTPFTGGDAGEGLDLIGTMVYAFNLGGTAQTVQGVNFVAADRTSLPTGLTMTGTAGNQFNYTGANPGGANAADYGATSDDDALETMVTSVWYDGSWTLDLAVTSGTQYQLQLILQEGFHNYQGFDGSSPAGRKTDISLEGVLGLGGFEPGIETNGLAQAGSDFGMVYTYQFTALDDSFTVSLDTVAGADPNSVLGAVTLEELGADTTPPDLAVTDPLSPADDATIGVAVGTDLVATLDEPVQAGTSGTIELRRTSPDQLIESFDVTSSPELTFGGTSVTINPTADLVGGVEYYVLIDVDAIVDTSSNGFAGITIGNWSFSPDVTAPTDPTVDSPANGATGVSPTAGLQLTFDEGMQKGTGNIVIKRVDDGTTVEDTIDVTTANVVISGGQVTITPTVILPSLTELYVEIADGALQDLAGNSFAGISGSGTWSFTTAGIVLFDDFSTDPNIGTEWTSYPHYSTATPFPDPVATWNSTDQDLDLVKATSGSGGWVAGLYRTGSSRTVADPVTLTVNELSRTDGTFAFMGLMISAVTQPGYITTDDDSYTFALFAEGGTNVRYQVRRTYLDGTGDFILYEGSSFDLATNGPVTLDIVRNGDHYEFRADGALLYTTATPAAGDFYDTAAKDSLVNYQIVFGGDAALTATVDDFGIGTVVAGDTFSDWQTANSTAGGLDDDHDGDGVENGVEFFLGGPNDTTGFTALPGVDNTGGTLSTTWAKAGDYPGTYGTDFWVETSSTLTDPWTTAILEPDSGFTVTITGNDVKFTFPTGTKDFARLVVVGP